jgi:L-fuculose-phosphate aldolase
MITEIEVRESLCEIGRRVWQRGYVASNDGNFSFRISENRIICTPTMMSKGFMRPDDLIEVDLEGNQVAGQRKLTSEIRLHLFLYQQRPDIYSVVHVHPPHALAFALTGKPLPKGLLPEVEVNLGEVPLVPYQVQGTWEFARSLEPWARTHNAFLLMNHGAVTVGQDPYDAYYRMETVDQYCRILLLAAQLGDWQKLDLDSMHKLLRIKEKMGLQDWRPADDLYSPEVRTTADHPDLPPVQAFRPHRGPITDEPKAGRA